MPDVRSRAVESLIAGSSSNALARIDRTTPSEFDKRLPPLAIAVSDGQGDQSQAYRLTRLERSSHHTEFVYAKPG
jgi:hypothetical protein